VGKGSRIRARRTQAIGSAIDRQLDDDCRWFENHPGVNQRIRTPYPEELALSEQLGSLMTHIEVIQVKSGVRIRQPLSLPHFHHDPAIALPHPL
jgi:hypothetical protein